MHKQTVTPKRSRNRVMNEIVAPWKVRLRLSKDARAETKGVTNTEPRLNAIGEAV